MALSPGRSGAKDLFAHFSEIQGSGWKSGREPARQLQTANGPKGPRKLRDEYQDLIFVSCPVRGGFFR